MALNFSPQTTFTVGSSPLSVAVGDFNGDSNPDLATANYGNNNVSVLLGNGSGGFGSQTTFAVGSSPVSVAVGDFNGDGNPDLATANFDSNNVSVLLGNGSGGFGSQTTFAVGGQPYSVAVGDLNGDSKPDLATENLNTNNVSVLLNTSTNNISGASGNDILTGTAASDAINGLAGSDRIDGGAGNDTINGGTGRDILVGGTGADVFQYDFLTDSIATAADAIRDFDQTSGDRFKLPFIPSGLFNAGSVAGTSLSLAATAAFANVGLGANQATFFDWTQGRKYLAVNDATAAFSASSDLVVEVTNIVQGSLTPVSYFI